MLRMIVATTIGTVLAEHGVPLFLPVNPSHLAYVLVIPMILLAYYLFLAVDALL